MSTIEKALDRLYRKPIPNDIRVSEVVRIAEWYGCEIRSGGNHQMKIVHKPTGTVIPIPQHSDTVKEAYIKELKALIDRIKEMEGEA